MVIWTFAFNPIYNKVMNIKCILHFCFLNQIKLNIPNKAGTTGTAATPRFRLGSMWLAALCRAEFWETAMFKLVTVYFPASVGESTMERKQNRYKHTHSFIKHHKHSIYLNDFFDFFSRTVLVIVKLVSRKTVFQKSSPFDLWSSFAIV